MLCFFAAIKSFKGKCHKGRIKEIDSVILAEDNEHPQGKHLKTAYTMVACTF